MLVPQETLYLNLKYHALLPQSQEIKFWSQLPKYTSKSAIIKAKLNCNAGLSKT